MTNKMNQTLWSIGFFQSNKSENNISHKLLNVSLDLKYRKKYKPVTIYYSQVGIIHE